jgi:hypothetical protein
MAARLGDDSGKMSYFRILQQQGNFWTQTAFFTGQADFYAAYCINWILQRGIQLTHVQHYLGSTVKMVFSKNFSFTFHEAIKCAAVPNA